MHYSYVQQVEVLHNNAKSIRYLVLADPPSIPSFAKNGRHTTIVELTSIECRSRCSRLFQTDKVCTYDGSIVWSLKNAKLEVDTLNHSRTPPWHVHFQQPFDVLCCGRLQIFWAKKLHIVRARCLQLNAPCTILLLAALAIRNLGGVGKYYYVLRST